VAALLPARFLGVATAGATASPTGSVVVAFAAADRLDRRGRTGSASAVAGAPLPAAVAAPEPVGDPAAFAALFTLGVRPAASKLVVAPFSRRSAEADLATCAGLLVAAILGAGSARAPPARLDAFVAGGTPPASTATGSTATGSTATGSEALGEAIAFRLDGRLRRVGDSLGAA